MNDEVTLDVVAEQSGVSRATASRALNNRDGVRADVRERVRTVAKALGYRPNRAAQNLAGGRASVIGLVIGQTSLGRNPYSTALIQEVAKAADQHNEGLMLLVDSKEPSEAVRDLLSDGLVDGVIVSAVAAGNRWVDQLLSAEVPTALIGYREANPNTTVIDVENLESSAKVVDHLLDTGCRRVATLTGPLWQLDAADRLNGFRLAHERRSLNVDEALIFNGDFTRPVGYQMADQILELEPDAVFCGNDAMAIGLYRRAIERGLRVPEDLSIAGFDGTSQDEYINPVLTSVAQPYSRLANSAVEALIAEITGHGTSGVKIFEPEVFYGKTTKTATGGAATNR